jgi:hypothetical protein
LAATGIEVRCHGYRRRGREPLIEIIYQPLKGGALHFVRSFEW